MIPGNGFAMAWPLKGKKMKFALVEEQRREAHPGLRGECPACSKEMIARCGDHRVWHWAHRGSRMCDTWWESETEWHRSWKGHFPEDWQEVIHWADDGEKHIADVKTENGVVLEFQHSHISREERESREAFYRRMVWVVDGLKRVRDRPRFFKSLGASKVIRFKPLTFSFPSDEGALMGDWAASSVPVFFDFGDRSEPNDVLHFNAPVLWCLNSKRPEALVHLSPVLKAEFLRAYRMGQEVEGMDYTRVLELVRKRALARYFVHQKAGRSRQTTGLRSYTTKKQRTRSRSRY